MKRYTTKPTDHGTVILTIQDQGLADDWGYTDDCPISIEYWVPGDGGYVREIGPDAPGTMGTQVCDGLEYRGACLSAAPDTLLSVIRREMRSRIRKIERENHNRL